MGNSIDVVRQYDYQQENTEYPNEGSSEREEKFGSSLVAIAGFISDLYAKRKKARKLSSMQDYLVNINNELQEVKEQNREILQKIELLHLEMEEVVRRDRLDKAYKLLNAYKKVFFSWHSVRSWDMGSGAALLYSYTDIATLEKDHLKVFELIWASDFLLLVSRYELRLSVLEVLLGRKGRIDAVLNHCEDGFERLLSALMSDLKSQYVKSYNLSLEPLEVVWSMTGHRTKTETTRKWVCEYIKAHEDGVILNPPPQCHWEEHTRTYPDAAYNGAHDQSRFRLESNYAQMRELHTKIMGLKNVSNDILGTYINCLEKDGWQPSEDEKVRFIDSDELLIKRELE